MTKALSFSKQAQVNFWFSCNKFPWSRKRTCQIWLWWGLNLWLSLLNSETACVLLERFDTWSWHFIYCFFLYEWLSLDSAYIRNWSEHRVSFFFWKNSISDQWPYFLYQIIVHAPSAEITIQTKINVRSSIWTKY